MGAKNLGTKKDWLWNIKSSSNSNVTNGGVYYGN